MENTARPDDTHLQTLADLDLRDNRLNERQTQLDVREQAIAERERQINAAEQSLKERMAATHEREDAVRVAEKIRDAGYAEERMALNREMEERRSTLDTELRNKRDDGEKELRQQREKKIIALTEEISLLTEERLRSVTEAEQRERARIQADIVEQMATWKMEEGEERKRLAADKALYRQQNGAMLALQGQLEERQRELELAQQIADTSEQRQLERWNRREAQLEDVVTERVEAQRVSMEQEKESMQEEIIRLRDSLMHQSRLTGAFTQLQKQLGGQDPAVVILELNRMTDDITRLRKELASRPSDEMRVRFQSLENEVRDHQARAERLAHQIQQDSDALNEVDELRRKNAVLQADNTMHRQRAEIFEGMANQVEAELRRLRIAYERPADEAGRHKDIEKEHVKADQIADLRNTKQDELDWLNDIERACSDYGLRFSMRILKAFHTSLKTAEWSPITILAGVSGTGKSELPRLYAHFGGIFFEPISVQPNWDSQESMLGFFNSIDNKFDAQPILSFLAQSQKPWSEDYAGLHDAVCLILLDEMNLAHPELYFAEFLSKLELRRGKGRNDVPTLPVKIGAGLDPYPLALGRNVLWTGTMNQDETTKSLSDKVIDRSIVINFPRPTELKRRPKLKPLNARNRGAILHRDNWGDWVMLESHFSDDDIKPFKQFIEQINAALAVTGRALGHRVWQSIEYYMANYPDVRAANPANKEKSETEQKQLKKAMHIAFEDQLVQKVMPKLRGIDTRGTSKTDCLDKIYNLIVTGIDGRPFNLTEDFDLACKLGYGQFIWQSANYLKDDPSNDSA